MLYILKNEIKSSLEMCKILFNEYIPTELKLGLNTLKPFQELSNTLMYLKTECKRLESDLLRNSILVISSGNSAFFIS